MWVGVIGLREITAGLFLTDVSMHSDVYEPISFKIGRISDSIELYILILV